MSNEFDSTDQKIMGLLREDSRKSFVDIGAQIGLSESAVRRRVKNLVDAGLIRRFTIEMGSGNKTSAITFISVDSRVETDLVCTKLRELEGVELIYEITGQYDIAVIISAPTIADINRSVDNLRRIEGVSDTNTVIVLRTIR
ncbi:MAG TPA: Lrp/AsnC family transcriptional regulator [Nitrososphaeraceae archaeon]|nr:Lrp/AsnC family transcriptional regulator [Nitrososphaeraceae archaeon]